VRAWTGAAAKRKANRKKRIAGFCGSPAPAARRRNE